MFVWVISWASKHTPPLPDMAHVMSMKKRPLSSPVLFAYQAAFKPAFQSSFQKRYRQGTNLGLFFDCPS